jgi:hypothetical protein
MGMSGEMLCSFLLSDARLDYSGRCLSFFLDSSSRLVLVSRRRTSFDFACLVHAMLSFQEAWNESFSRAPSELLFGELLGVVLVLRWEAKLL